MKGETKIKFSWMDGINFGHLSKILHDHLAREGLTFKRIAVPSNSGSGLFEVMRYVCEPPFEFPHGPWENVLHTNRKIERVFEFTDAPWEDDPWPKPGIGTISWVVLLDPSINFWWGSFYIRIEDNLPFSGNQWPIKVHLMRLAIDGSFCQPCGETPDQFSRLCRQYHQIKVLYDVLGCDELIAEDILMADDDMRAIYPMHRHADLRIAKEGTQVLSIRMEERKQRLDLDWFNSRIFIDPPGTEGLTPKEYHRRWLKESKDKGGAH